MTLSKSIFSINIQTNSLNIKLVRQLCNNYNIRGFSPWWCFLMAKPPQFYCCLCHRHNSSSSSSSSSSLRPSEDSLCCVFSVFSFADCRSLSRQIWTKSFDFWPRLEALLCWGSQRTNMCTGTSMWCRRCPGDWCSLFHSLLKWLVIKALNARLQNPLGSRLVIGWIFIKIDFCRQFE